MDWIKWWMNCMLAIGNQSAARSGCKKQKLMNTEMKAQKKDCAKHNPLLFLRSRPDSNRCRSFCRALPNHSATGPFKNKNEDYSSFHFLTLQK